MKKAKYSVSLTSEDIATDHFMSLLRVIFTAELGGVGHNSESEHYVQAAEVAYNRAKAVLEKWHSLASEDAK